MGVVAPDIVDDAHDVKLLFVCLGNICRSPTAHGVMRKLLDDAGHHHVHVDSCGTSGMHHGEPPDPRTVLHAKKRGYDLSTLRSRPLADADFVLFDRIWAMDQQNLKTLARRCPPEHAAKLGLFLDVIGPGLEVPDPWSGGPAGFEHVLDLVERAAQLHVRSAGRGPSRRTP